METTLTQDTTASAEARADERNAVRRLIAADAEVSATFDRAVIARQRALDAEHDAEGALWEQTAARINLARLRIA